jgi:hypothetical protein
MEKSSKIRVPKWVSELVALCPDATKTSSYYKALSLPTIPGPAFFKNLLGSLPIDKRQEVVFQHILPKLQRLLEETTLKEADKELLKRLCQILDGSLNESQFSRYLAKGVWADDLLNNQVPEEMKKAVSPYELFSRLGVSSYIIVSKPILRLVQGHIETIEPTPAAMVTKQLDTSYRLSEHIRTPRRDRLYELVRHGFGHDFQPLESSIGLYALIIVQTLSFVLKGQPSPFRRPEITSMARAADFSMLAYHTDVGVGSEEHQLMVEYLKRKRLAPATMNLGMKILSDSLVKKVVDPAKVRDNPQAWANLALYRMMGQITPTKPPIQTMLVLGYLTKTPLHQMLLWQYEMSLLLGRRMCYLPTLDVIHAYMHMDKALLDEDLNDYKERYFTNYVKNMERLPSSNALWMQHLHKMFEKAELSGCTTPLQFIRKLYELDGTLELIPEQVSPSQATEELTENAYDFEELNSLELDELELEDDDDDSEEVSAITKLFNHDDAVSEPEPITPTKGEWNWD